MLPYYPEYLVKIKLNNLYFRSEKTRLKNKGSKSPHAETKVEEGGDFKVDKNQVLDKLFWLQTRAYFFC
jgi:hypothetical protein